MGKKKSRIEVVYRNYNTFVGKVRKNPFKTSNRNSKRSFKMLN